MSPAGVSILTTSPLPVGMEIEVHFGLDESQTSGKLQMRAVVRHCSAGRILNVDSAQGEHWWQIMRGARWARQSHWEAWKLPAEPKTL